MQDNKMPALIRDNIIKIRLGQFVNFERIKPAAFFHNSKLQRVLVITVGRVYIALQQRKKKRDLIHYFWNCFSLGKLYSAQEPSLAYHYDIVVFHNRTALYCKPLLEFTHFVVNEKNMET